MTTKHTLTLLAAALSATSVLHAQPETPETVTAILQNIATPAQPAAATLEQRAAALGVLALIPADAESFAAIPHAAQSARNLLSQPILRIGPGINLNNLLSIIGMVKSAAIAAGPGTSEFLGKNIIQASALPNIYSTYNAKKHLLLGDLETEEWQESRTDIDDAQREKASRQRKIRFQQEMLEINRNLLRSSAPILSGIAPSMQNISLTAVAELHPASLSFIRQALNDLKEEISQSSGHALAWHEGTYAGYDWKGVSFDGKACARLLENEYRNNQIEPDANERKGLEALSLVKFHYLVAVRDDKAIFTICSDPAKNINIASTPAESILATDKIAFADARLSNNPDFLFHLDKSLGEGVATGIASLAGQLDADAYMQSLPIQMDCLSKLYRSISAGNIGGTIWADKGIHLEITQETISALDLNSPLQLLPHADRPETMLYGECTTTPLVASLLGTMLDDDVKAITESTSQIRLPKEAADIWNNVKTAFSGMNGKTAVLIDNKGTLPLDYPNKEIVAYNIAMPRIALYKGVDNRRQTSAAWDSVWASIGTMAKGYAIPVQTEKVAGDGIDIYQLSGWPAPRRSSTTLFGPSGQIFRDLSIALTDRACVIGIPETYVKDIALAAATPPSDLKGAAFALRTEPIKDMIARNDAYLMGNNKEFAGMLTAMYSFIASQIDGLYGTITAEGNKTRTHIYLRTK